MGEDRVGGIGGEFGVGKGKAEGSKGRVGFRKGGEEGGGDGDSVEDEAGDATSKGVEGSEGRGGELKEGIVELGAEIADLER